ncbi:MULTISPECIES: glycosyltransferase [Flavobacteriaceae]|uniref:Glycosyltransferase n=2 Tax=Flavobacteriaceae TaxID=49546 RepID=A0A4Y8ASW7_9FLAO|nr:MULTISPECIES: glycosyltransferase [Flavobacteriaceae]TEW74948.1 glycosyltransferase [Gramella jeungdoensis]GGK42827.1 glycosyl transferase [Lutibacter litoralis]
MIFIAAIISICYFSIICSLIIGFDKLKNIENKNTIPKNKFSIIVPFRNEAKNLPLLLHSFSEIAYPKTLFEIILVNDASSDNYIPIIEAFKIKNPTINYTLINNTNITNSPKKEALTTAIKISKFNWIVTTDADCNVQKNWLNLFNQTIEDKNALFIAAPVKFKYEATFLHHFQNLNFISLLGSTIGSFGIKKPIMCNGANLCYNKATFFELNGFEGNEAITSGDDIFLLEKIAQKSSEKVCYLKANEAIVATSSEKNWSQFFNQQLRWASKTTTYNNWFSKFVGLIVFIENLLVIILGGSSLFISEYWMYFIIVFISKILLDFILIFKTANFFNSPKWLHYYLIISVIYSAFIVLIALSTLFKNYQWKDRVFKK